MKQKIIQQILYTLAGAGVITCVAAIIVIFYTMYRYFDQFLFTLLILGGIWCLNRLGKNVIED